MSVVVRMEMPKKCVNCPAWCICGTIHKYMLGIDCDSDWTYDDLLVLTDETGFIKPDDCPIICQLPEGHGRLIDASTIIGEVDAGYTDDYGNPIPANRPISVDEYLGLEVPTIVPAERKDNGETC